MKKSLKQKAYDYILGKITSGEFQPGRRLGEVSMAQEIGISPTPLREAFRQLTAEGILEHRPNSGIIVAEIDEQKIIELYEVREALEAFCAGQAALKMNRIDTGLLQECLDRQLVIARKLKRSGREVFSSGDEIEYLKTDAKFHLLIFNASRNSIIDRMMRECHILGRLIGFNSHKHNLTQVSTTLKHHYRILKYIKKQDPVKTEFWMRSHIRFSRETALVNRNGGKQHDSEWRTYSEALYNSIYKMETDN